MRPLFVVLTMLFALSAGFVMTENAESQNILRSKRSLFGGSASGGASIGGSIGIGGGAGIGGIIGGITGGIGGIAGGIETIIQGFADIAGSISGSITEIGASAQAIAAGGITVSAQAQLSGSLKAVGGQLDRVHSLVENVPASVNQAGVAKINGAVSALVELRASLTAALHALQASSASQSAQLIAQIQGSIQKIDSIFVAIKTKVPSAKVPEIGGSGNNGGNTSGGISGGIGGSGSIDIDLEGQLSGIVGGSQAAQEIVLVLKAILQNGGAVAGKNPSAENKENLDTALNQLDGILDQGESHIGLISSNITEAEAEKIKTAIAVLSKIRAVLVVVQQKIINAGGDANAVNRLQIAIDKIDTLVAELKAKLEGNGSGSGSGNGGNGTGNSTDLRQEIAATLQSLLVSVGPVAGGSASLEEQQNLEAALIRLNDVLAQVSNQIKGNSTVGPIQASKIRRAIALLTKLRTILVSVQEKLTNAGANPSLIARLRLIITKVDSIKAALEAKLEGSGNGSGEGSGNGSGEGSENGSGEGSGNGSGEGSGNGSGEGSGNGNGEGSGNGNGEGSGNGSGEGSGNGNGEGSGNGNGEGSGNGSGEGSGNGNGEGSGNGSGEGSGNGNGEGSGNGNGEGSGNGSGEGSGNGSGEGSGNGNGEGSGGNNTDLIQEISASARVILGNVGGAAAGLSGSQEKIAAALSQLDKLLAQVGDRIDEISAPVNPVNVAQVNKVIGDLARLKGILKSAFGQLQGGAAASQNTELVASLQILVQKVDILIVSMKGKLPTNSGSGSESGNTDGNSEGTINNQGCGSRAPTVQEIKQLIVLRAVDSLVTRLSTSVVQLPTNLNAVQLGQAQAALSALSSVRAKLASNLQELTSGPDANNSRQLIAATANLLVNVNSAANNLSDRIPCGQLSIGTLPANAINNAVPTSAIPNLLQQIINSVSAINRGSVLIR